MRATNCAICGCILHHGGNYALPTVEGRSHATRHHYVAERFFGRSANRRGEKRAPIFGVCPWSLERLSCEFCYECHEELLHNPVLTPEDVNQFAELVRRRSLDEKEKTESKVKLAGRIELLHEVIQAGIKALL